MRKNGGRSERKHGFGRNKKVTKKENTFSEKKDSKSSERRDVRPSDKKEYKSSDKKAPKFNDKKGSKFASKRENKFSKEKDSFKGRPSKKKEIRSVFDKRKLNNKSDKKVQFLDASDLNYRTKLDKQGFRNKNESKVPTIQELDNTEIRLNKFIAEAGVCSRREADELISHGLITVNGKEVRVLGTKVKPTDRVKYDGKLLSSEEKTYLLLNKPKGFITTTSDPEDRQTVMDIVSEATPNRVYPVGRLDRNTTGVLLLTNDGDFMEKVTHPKFNITKIYKVGLDRRAESAELQKLLDGVMLEDGVSKADNIAFLDETGKNIGIEIHSGKNRVIRRMFEHLEMDVKSLDRTSFGPFTKTNLRPGQFRQLNDKEMALVARLRKQKVSARKKK